jgi:hypothetical protein
VAISSAVPIREREEALQDELRSEGKPMKTGELTKRVLSKFVVKLSPAELARVTPSGYPWWTGCLRLDLNRLLKKGKVRRPSKGYWEIVNGNINQAKPKLDKLTRRSISLLEEVLRAAKSGEVPIEMTIKDGEFTVRIGKDIKETTFKPAR